MKRFLPFLVMQCLLTASLAQQNPTLPSVQSPPWDGTHRLCGRVLLEGPGHKRIPARSVPVETYKVLSAEDSCCERRNPVRKARTDSDGKFEFKGLVPGLYWVVLKVAPQNPKKSFILESPVTTSGCGNKFDDYVIDAAGHLTVEYYIEITATAAIPF